MALFPPEFLASILLAFAQLRLRSHCSLASWLVNGLNFFLPPEDELIATLNGQQQSLKGSKRLNTPGQPLSAAEKMATFYVRMATTESGVFTQTLFYELYEMLVVFVSSTVLGCWIGNLVSYAALWLSWNNEEGDSKLDMATYGLLSAILVAIWFPLQLNVVQGWATYEARLGLAAGLVGFIAAGFVILAPKGMLDFDLERAVQVLGQRLALVLRALGFTDADFVHLAPWTETLRVALLLSFAVLAGIFTCTTFLPSFRFARMYLEMIKDKRSSMSTKLQLYLDLIFPVVLCALWIPRLSKTVLVPSELVKCSPRAFTRDCLQDEIVGITTWASSDVWKWYSLTESQFHTLRMYVVWMACLVRWSCFRTFVQHFLLEPREVLAAHVGRPGLVDGALLQNQVRLQFNYVPILALQYLAPLCALVAAAQLLMKQTATSLGLFHCLSWMLQQLAPTLAMPAKVTPRGLHAVSLNVLPEPLAVPDLGGFTLGQDVTQASLTRFFRGMSHFPLLTADFFDASLGFLIWFLNFTVAGVRLAGLLYWRHVAGHGPAPRHILLPALHGHGLNLSVHFARLRLEERRHGVHERRIAGTQDADGEETRIRGIPDRDRGHGHPPRHLDDAQERIVAIQRRRLDGHAHNRNRREGCEHAGQVSSAACPGNQHLETTARSALSVLIHSCRRAMSRDNRQFVRDTKLLEHVGRRGHRGKIRLGAHDDPDQRLAL
ncbi:hypothetical protein PsorP6_012582 [Peronosclerospora sorghi]|uniref:Uncharacterized protein n=1 Tax=Peronosclerospora sorghi TaxID=230839 RepID=A0ACC0WGZ1_9STRA|nr:hypothetical protein PsorP6_012582 [Peronosclerospora sorghi]